MRHKTVGSFNAIIRQRSNSYYSRVCRSHIIHVNIGFVCGSNHRSPSLLFLLLLWGYIDCIVCSDCLLRSFVRLRITPCLDRRRHAVLSTTLPKTQNTTTQSLQEQVSSKLFHQQWSIKLPFRGICPVSAPDCIDYFLYGMQPHSEMRSLLMKLRDTDTQGPVLPIDKVPPTTL